MDGFSNFNCILYFFDERKVFCQQKHRFKLCCRCEEFVDELYISTSLSLEVLSDPGESCTVTCFCNLLPWIHWHLARLRCYRKQSPSLFTLNSIVEWHSSDVFNLLIYALMFESICCILTFQLYVWSTKLCCPPKKITCCCRRLSLSRDELCGQNDFFFLHFL